MKKSKSPLELNKLKISKLVDFATITGGSTNCGTVITNNPLNPRCANLSGTCRSRNNCQTNNIQC